MQSEATLQAICFDWGGTLMSEEGPDDLPMAHWPSVRAMDGAIETLEYLHGRIPLCIATNASVSTRSMIQLALSRVALDRYFDHIFCATELGYRKDHPGFWDIVESTLGVPLSRIAMIGDSLSQDVFAPKRFGMFSIWFNPNGRHPDPGREVRSVTRLSDLVKILSSRI